MRLLYCFKATVRGFWKKVYKHYLRLLRWGSRQSRWLSSALILVPVTVKHLLSLMYKWLQRLQSELLAKYRHKWLCQLLSCLLTIPLPWPFQTHARHFFLFFSYAFHREVISCLTQGCARLVARIPIMNLHTDLLIVDIWQHLFYHPHSYSVSLYVWYIYIYMNDICAFPPERHASLPLSNLVGISLE